MALEKRKILASSFFKPPSKRRKESTPSIVNKRTAKWGSKNLVIPIPKPQEKTTYGLRCVK